MPALSCTVADTVGPVGLRHAAATRVVVDRELALALQPSAPGQPSAPQQSAHASPPGSAAARQPRPGRLLCGAGCEEVHLALAWHELARLCSQFCGVEIADIGHDIAGA